MKLISHRRNRIEELKSTSFDYGVEIDLRTWQDKVVLQHDPFIEGEDFDEWLKYYSHGTLILNVKEEGIEYLVKEKVEAKGITDYFFLDLSFPFLVKMANTGESRIAVRFSEYESVETVLKLKGKVDWVWVDCFTQLPLDDQTYKALKKSGFNLCLVSPELQGRPDELSRYKQLIKDNNWTFNAVCSKQPLLWQ
jgi:hypothetical protein